MVNGTLIATGNTVVGIVSGSHTVFASVNPANQAVIGILSSDFAPYSGEYEITPSEATQILNTANRSLTGNVTINPIPDNYARMAWDGTTLYFY